MGPIVVHDEMEIEAGLSFDVDLLEKPDKLLMPMARQAISNDPTVEQAEGSKKRRRAMTDVIMGHGSAPAFLQRQSRLGSVQSLDLAFLVQTQNQGLVRGIQVQSHHVAQLFDEVLVAAELEGADQVGLQVVLFPDSADGRFADVLGGSHGPRAPVRRSRRRCLHGRFNHSLDLPRRDAGKTARPRSVFFQARYAQGQKTFPPKLDRRTRDLQPLGDLLIPHSLGGQPDDLGSLNQAQGKASGLSPGPQRRLFLGGQDDGLGCSAHCISFYPPSYYLSSYL